MCVCSSIVISVSVMGQASLGTTVKTTFWSVRLTHASMEPRAQRESTSTSASAGQVKTVVQSLML